MEQASASDPRPVPQPGAPVIDPLGLDGLLVRFGTGATPEASRAVLALQADLADRPLPGTLEVAGALASVYLRFDLAEGHPAQMRTALAERLEGRDWGQAPLPCGRRLWRIPACFEGACAPDLAEVAELTGCADVAAIEEICAARMRALAIGFAPGQAYFGDLPAHWNFPRRTGLTPAAPRGAIVVAVRQLLIFSTQAPTGWRQVGRTAFRPFDPARGGAPFAFRAGDEICLTAIDPEELSAIESADHGGLGGATVEDIA